MVLTGEHTLETEALSYWQRNTQIPTSMIMLP